MEVFLYKDDFIKMYADGIEKKYKGKSIEYDGLNKTFVYYYYTNHQRLYIIDGKSEDFEIPHVDGSVRLIIKFEDKQVKLFKKHLKNLIKSKKIFTMSDEFFIDLGIILRKKGA